MTSDIRRFAVAARSTDVFGRIILSARTNHVVIDGPIQNGCLGEAVTPPEAFLGAVAACGAELVQVIARDQGIAFDTVSVAADGVVDRGDQARSDITVVNQLTLHFTFTGVSESDAEALVRGFQARCPLYGTVAAAVPDVRVTWEAA